MTRAELITNIEAATPDLDLTINRAARFKKHPLKALYFYTLVALNRFTPLLLPIKARTLWGHHLYAYETSAIGSMHFLGFYDREITLFLLQYFKEPGDILDVGANIGVYTSLFTQIAKSDAKIVAFEPTPSTYTVLHNNVGHLPQVETTQLALSDHAGTITFFDYGLRHGVFNSTTAQPLDFLRHQGKEINVPTTTLDVWCSEHAVRPSLIKLDTEGTEASILTHSSQVLTTYQPVILLEVGGGEAWSKNNNDSLDILTTHQYQFFTVSDRGELVPHTRQASYQYTNLVCIPAKKVSLYVRPT
jgi:FkbM family methyltransferase